MLLTYKLSVLFTLLLLNASLRCVELKEVYYCDLNRNVELVIDLIKQDKLLSIFKQEEHKKIRVAIKNMSPADFALQIELDNNTIPVIFYFHKDLLNLAEKTEINTIAKKYHTKFKIIVINIEELYIFRQAVIKSFPAAIIVYTQEQIQIINEIDPKNIQQDLEKLIENFNIKLIEKNQ